MCVCMCAPVKECLRNPEKGIGSPKAGVSGASWVLGTELQSFARAVCVLNHCVISLVSKLGLFFLDETYQLELSAQFFK